MGIYEMKKPKRINSFSVTLFIIVAVSGYLLYWYIPVWWPVFQMQGIMKGVCNTAYHTHDNKKLKEMLLKESRRSSLRVTEDNFRLTREPYTPDELRQFGANGSDTHLLELRGKSCRLEFVYELDSMLPIIEKSIHLRFDKEVETKLDVVTYDKGCD